MLVKEEEMDKKNKKAQVTVFIIIAVILVAAVALFFVLRENIFVGHSIPASIQPVYNTFLSCVEQDALTGIDVLESQAGYIELPDFEPGSAYMPFSNQLDFLGNPIPYWYYVSGNNIQKEQVPSKNLMQEHLGDYIENEIRNCVFENYYEQGFEITQGIPKASVNINDNTVSVDLDMSLSISKGEDSSVIKNHKLSVKTELGRLYNNAKKVYANEQNNLFLENYAVDTLRLYAPVDGVEITCSPKTWNADSVFDDLQNAIEANTLSLKVKGEKNDYFVVDAGTDSDIDVRFLNSKNWANGFEVNPSEGVVMMSKPVGNQPGLGILGFCYAPYHFVYNIRYPVLVQVYSDSSEEIFQFPVAVVLQGNKPREALDSSGSTIDAPELCKYKNTEIQVNVYDTKLNLVDADISYECFSEFCEIGKTSSGILRDNFPQCVNGFIAARAKGFEDTKYQYSTTNDGSADIIMDKLYEININLKLDNKDYGKDAIISFISDESSKTIVYPEQKIIELSEGQYEIQIYVYKNSTIKIAETTQEQCVEVSKSGLGGIFGMKEEKCFDIVIPEQIISNAISGGGKENYYILESELQNSKSIEINAESLPVPTSIEQLQSNYLLFEERGLDINFR